MSDYGLLMNSEFGFSKGDEVKESMPVTKEKESGDKKIKIVKIIFCLLCVILAVELVVYKYVMPCLGSPKVTVSGQNNYSAEEIAMKLLSMNSTSWVDFDVDQATSLIGSDAGIEHVSVEKRFPDRIYINIIEREPVAVTFIMEGGCSTPVQIDKSGFLFPLKDKEVLNTNTLPIVSGLQVENMSGGMKIQNQYISLMEQISNISAAGKNYFAGLSEICVIPTDKDSYELALIPSQSKVKVLTERTLNEDALKYMMVVLDVINKLDTEVSEVDLRYGSISCKIK